MLCAKFGWNWSREDNFWILSMYFSLFRYYLPLEMNKYPSFEQIWTPFTQGWFMLSLVEIGPVLLEKMIFRFSQCNWIPSPKDALCQYWLKVGHRFWRRRRKCEKVTTTNNGQTSIRIAHLSLWLSWAKNWGGGAKEAFRRLDYS